MPLTLLLDLDDTLLDTNLDVFIPAYFQALAGALSARVEPDIMLPALVGGTKRMLANEDSALTLKEVFDAHFYSKLGMDRDSLQSEIDRFYDEIFPSLGYLTKPRPTAVELVDWAFEQGFRVAIATNPLFPLKAVHHRMRWAGLPPEKYPFVLVTAYETMHFTKSPAYYAEVMARMGWPGEPVIMVGDDPTTDVTSARMAGIAVFHVTASGKSDLTPPPDGAGTIADVRGWLESTDLSQFEMKFDTPEAILAVLRSTPAGLAGLVGDIPADQWSRCPECDEWSLNEIICHLRDVELEVNIPRMRTVLEETNPFIAGQVTDNWVEEREYDLQNGREALKMLTDARKQFATLLADLSTDDWKRVARHSIFGPTDLQELVNFIAGHDRSHVQQVAKTIVATVA